MTGSAEDNRPDDAALGDRQTFWRAEAGVRSALIRNAGYDPFSTSDNLTQFSLGFSRTVFQKDRFSFAPGVIWDYGTSSARARSAQASLDVHRLAATLEGRYHVAPFLYALVRFAPGALHQSVSISESSSLAPLVDARWTFSMDASVGAAYLIGPQRHASIAAPRWWLTAEGGYGWVAAHDVTPSPDLGNDDPRQTDSINLGSMALRGPFFRLLAAVTY